MQRISVIPALSSGDLKSLCYLQSVSLSFILWKSASPEANDALKKKVKVNVFNLSDEVKS
jgi:hypothetical protein